MRVDSTLICVNESACIYNFREMVACVFFSSGKVFQHEGQEFYLNTEQKMTWRDARRWCQEKGGDLAQPQGGWDLFREQVLQLLPPREYTITSNI